VAGTRSIWFYALDESTGTVLWGPTAIQGTNGWSGLAYDHGTVFIVTTPGVLSTFNAATGTPGWSEQVPNASNVTAAPTAVNGVVYISAEDTLIAVDETDGSLLWEANVEGGGNSSPTVSPDGVFVSYATQVYKFDPLIGTPLWHYRGPLEGFGGATTAYANGQLFVRDANTTTPPGEIFDAETGKQLAAFSATATPAFSATTGFFLNSGTLNAVDQTTQQTLWTFSGDGGLISAPIVIDAVVVIGSSSGTVYALDTATGNVIWSGSAGAAISTNEGDTFAPLTGLGAGEGYLVVPAGNVLSGWKIVP
jgi:outer membrane protein assembly factor BamB